MRTSSNSSLPGWNCPLPSRRSAPTSGDIPGHWPRRRLLLRNRKLARPDDFSLSIFGRRDVADADRGARGGTSGVCGYDREELPAPGYSLEVVDASIFEPDS